MKRNFLIIKIILPLLLILISFPFNSFSNSKPNKEANNKIEPAVAIYPKDWDGKTVKLPVIPGEGLFTFKIISFTSEEDIYFDGMKYMMGKEIFIYRDNQKEPFQILKPAVTESPPIGNSGLSVIDFDGDGDFDLRVLDWWGATGNIGYKVFLYDQDENLFKYSKMYSDLSRPQPDGNGCVTSGGTGGHAGQIYSRGYYCPKGEKLVPKWEERQDWVREGKFYMFYRVEWNDKQKMIRDTVEQRNGIDKETGEWLVTWFSESVWNEKTKCYDEVVKSIKDNKLVTIHRESKCE